MAKLTGKEPLMIENPTVGDAFGEALLEELTIGNAFEVAERDDGHIGVHPIARYFAEYPQWPPLEAKAIDSVGSRVLDVGAGAGRAALELQNRGVEVLAVDTSPSAIDVCRSRGVAQVQHGTILDIPHDIELFDTVLMLGGNFGFLQSPTAGRDFLMAVAAVTSPGAQLFGINTEPGLTEDPAHLRYYARNQAAGRASGQLRLRIRHKRTATPWFEYWLMSEQEIEQVVNGTPWRLAHLDRDGARYLATLIRE
ncbi:class I SAM-dependent methyltransferase [Nocardia sp. CDC160]|uniref:class I SAM-dependent methyltransferase n=1 Tax=Nocardia sp. CDC160 TaxID=3112166 RepID=UPI002DB7EA41|nr:methyltransferase domain-containing protein [Nocardia sp. CDC160]MEC3915522.1 methyltransferase domain-containing protein [Nocardia sp. CDC160]